MKTEIINVPGKGICILISDIDPKDFIHGIDKVNTLGMCSGPFTNIHAIAEQIRIGRKIGAIKEIRAQTGWGLREAKEYIDKFAPNIGYDVSVAEAATHYNNNANRFLQAHMPEEFIDGDEFKI
jgi:hypothetical protein